MNIVYIVNNNPLYIDMLLKSIESISYFNSNVNFYVINTSNKHLNLPNNITQISYPIKKQLRARNGVFDRLCNVSYVKLDIPDLLPSLDKVLFVDCDCLCLDTLDDIWNLDPNYLYLSPNKCVSKERINELHSDSSSGTQYYSTGIMLMNLKTLREDNFKDKCFKNIDTIPCSFWCHEETLINYNYYDKIQMFKENVQEFRYASYKYNDYEIIKKNLPNIKFLHFGGDNKNNFFKFANFLPEIKFNQQIQILKNKLSITEFLSNKNLKISIDENHTQMKFWFKDRNLVSNIKDADVAIFHGTNYSNSNSSIRKRLEDIVKYQVPIISLEDVFIRSIFPGRAKVLRNFKNSVGFCLANILHFEQYYSPTSFDTLVENTPDLNSQQIKNVHDCLNFIIKNRISKYNCAFDPMPSNYKNSVVVIDQAFGDQSICNSYASDITFKECLLAALKENPNKQIIIKTHVENLTGGTRGGFYGDICKWVPKSELYRIIITNKKINPIEFLINSYKVYVVSSGMGFEALICKKPVITFGCPFYSGYGLTDDRNPNVKIKTKISFEKLFYCTYVLYSIYKHPETGKIITLEEALKYILFLRKKAFGK